MISNLLQEHYCLQCELILIPKKGKESSKHGKPKGNKDNWIKNLIKKQNPVKAYRDNVYKDGTRKTAEVSGIKSYINKMLEGCAEYHKPKQRYKSLAELPQGFCFYKLSKNSFNNFFCLSLSESNLLCDAASSGFAKKLLKVMWRA